MSDLFELNGEWYLTCCPQGVEQNGLDYANVHQSCWMKIDADFDNNHFEVKEIHQLDRGTDFYAQQSFVDEKGRRIMIGWLEFQMRIIQIQQWIINGSMH